MKRIEAYKYKTKQEVVKAIKICNDRYLPNKKVGDTTKNWVPYHKAELNEPAFFYILHYSSLNEVLGEPIEIEITEDLEL
jgi:hypothetical protein